MLKNSWIFPVVQSFHLVGIAIMAGTIVLNDLRILGIQRQTITPSWTRIGFSIVLITGPFLFIADIARYTANPAFLVKMILLALAFAVHFLGRETKLAAALSMILWTSVVLGGRAIADFDV